MAPDAWVKWVTQSPDVVSLDFLDAEFQWVSRQNDVLIRAYSPTLGHFLIPNELQLRFSARMPLRLRAYAALAQEKFDLPVYPVLINILPPPESVLIPSRFESEFLGLHARQDFRVINLWQVPANLVFEQSLSTLLPFVPVLQGGDQVPVIQQALLQLRQDQAISELEPLLAFFASFVLESDLVRQVMRWDMAVLQESPWYQEIEQKGVAKGELSLVLRLLSRRVGELSPDTQAQIRSLALPQVEALGEALLDFSSLQDLHRWLQTQV
nr:DUF4351 domain-containing protein [Petrachloros mirabilis]